MFSGPENRTKIAVLPGQAFLLARERERESKWQFFSIAHTLLNHKFCHTVSNVVKQLEKYKQMEGGRFKAGEFSLKVGIKTNLDVI